MQMTRDQWIFGSNNVALNTACPSDDQLQQAHRPFVDIGAGHRLFLRDWGRGRPVLFLAGWAMDSSIWGATMAALNAFNVRTIAYDRRGHGRSTDPGAIDYDLLADDLAAVIETLDLHDLTIVTHSGAAGEAIRYITRHGDARLARLLLVGPAGPCMIGGPDNPYGLPREAISAVLSQLSDDLPSWIDANVEPFAPSATRRTLDWLAGLVLQTSRRLLLDFQQVIAEADLRAEAAALKVPVTVIHGTQDASTPLEITGQRYREIISGAELVIYEGAAHGIMITHTARLAADIAARLAEV
ncbi:MAG TPA: alpha/beta hydrolase [Pedomonas sp.]|uniref:alpha/beta fold hydrolase n=1 Tax=Pedomonas sp. TaxID=2976421 RepID=UPI002F41C943